MDCIDLSTVGLMKVAIGLIVATKIYTVLTYGECKSKNRVDGKVVIVTGANSGE